MTSSLLWRTGEITEKVVDAEAKALVSGGRGIDTVAEIALVAVVALRHVIWQLRLEKVHLNEMERRRRRRRRSTEEDEQKGRKKMKKKEEENKEEKR